MKNMPFSRPPTRWHRRFSGLLAVAGLLFLGAASALAQGTFTVHIVNFDFQDGGGAHFDPTIDVGDTVHWIWDSGFHSTTSAAGQLESWDSGRQFSPASFDHIFTHAGTFNYYCLVHGSDLGGGNVSGMSGHVTVLAVPEPAAAGLMLAGVGAFLALRRRVWQARARGLG
jgi:plastocyanin